MLFPAPKILLVFVFSISFLVLMLQANQPVFLNRFVEARQGSEQEAACTTSA